MSEENRNVLPEDQDIEKANTENPENNTDGGTALSKSQADAISRLASSDGLRKDKAIKKTNMGRILLIALIVCALGVGLFLLAPLLLPAEEPQSEYVDNTRPVALSERTKADVSRVELNSGDKRTVYLMGADGTIYVESDPDFPLNQTSAGSIFYAFAALTTEDTIEDDSSRKAEFGFDPPNAVATVTYTDGEVRSYYLGSKTPLANTWYFMAEGRDEIFTVWVNVGNYMTSDYTTLRRASSIVVPDTETIVSLIVENSYGVIDIAPYIDGVKTTGFYTWYMTRPYNVDCDTEYLTEYMTTLSALAVKSYAGSADDLAKYGLSEADSPARLYMEDAEGLTIELLIGAQMSSTEYYAWSSQLPGEVFTVTAAQAEAILFAKPFPFTNIFAALITITDVKGFELEIDGKKHTAVIDREFQYDDEGKVKMLTDTQYDYLYTYYFDGVLQDESTFRTAYQSLIGVTVEGGLPLSADGVIDKTGLTQSNIACRIVYHYYDDLGYEDTEVVFVPYKSLYYAVKTTETGDFYFYSAKEKVQKITTALETLNK